MPPFRTIALGLLTVLLGAAQATQAATSALDFSLPTHPVGAIAEPPRQAVVGKTLAKSETVVQVSDRILTFTLPPPETATVVEDIPATKLAVTGAVEAAPVSTRLHQIFAGGSDSLVARAVGNAEGTRTPDGGKTRAYYGHVDPGNGVWNLGSFSYQHGARSPAEADEKQLRRLQMQAKQLRKKAAAKGISLSLEAELNGLDLANQSPRAALTQGGYVERLRQAYQRGLKGADAVLWARVQSYRNPDTQRWQAPGLGNREGSITRDQERRLQAVRRTMQWHLRQAEQATVPSNLSKREREGGLTTEGRRL